MYRNSKSQLDIFYFWWANNDWQNRSANNFTLFKKSKANWAFFEFAAQNRPIQGWLGRTAVEYIFLKKDFCTFNAYFLKWMLNSCFLTSITYGLTPRTSNLLRFEAWSTKQGFSTASGHRGRDHSAIKIQFAWQNRFIKIKAFIKKFLSILHFQWL